MTNEFEENVFEAMDDLRGDNRVAVPDVGTIRRRAERQQARMRAAMGAACLAIIGAIGFGVWASGEESPATTETAGVDEGVLQETGTESDSGSVASDSAPSEIVGQSEISSTESFGEWMLANRLQTDGIPSVSRLVARDEDPTTEGVRLSLAAFPLGGSFEYFTVFSAECGPRLEHGMIRFTDGNAVFFDGLTPESENIAFADVGYDCSPPRPERLGSVIERKFEIIPTATGLRFANNTEHVDFVLTDLEGNPLVEAPETDGLRIASVVDIVTGEPEGSRGMQALSSFTLQYDPDLNCLYHDELDNNGEPGTGGRVVVVWHAGYSAVRDGEGVAVLNPAGDIVARSGETFQIGGGMRTGGSSHCDSIGQWIANGGPTTLAEQPASTTRTTIPPTITAQRPFISRGSDCMIGDLNESPLTNLPCDDPHDFELYREALIGGSVTEVFDEVAIGGYADEVCATSLEAYVPGAKEKRIDFISFHPTEASWNNAENPDRVVSCVLYSLDGQLVGRASG